jgi:hypothetical protein
VAATHRVTSVARGFSTTTFFLAATREEVLRFAMVLMMGKEPIAGERGECSSVGNELEWQSSDDSGREAAACGGGLRRRLAAVEVEQVNEGVFKCWI